MKSLRNRFERFCFNHRNWGIPNLMLYIVLGSAVVYLLTMINGGSMLYYYLYFNKELILQGQVWRLFTHVFTSVGGKAFLVLISLYCYYSLGRALENSWGTFRFNLFIWGSVVLMDIFAMIFSTPYTAGLYTMMPYYLDLSLLLAFATTYPDTQFTILFVIPIKARILSLVYLVLIFWEVFANAYPDPSLLFPHYLFPLVGLVNYFLIMGKDVLNLLPYSWRRHTPKKKKAPKAQPSSGQAPKTIRFTKEKADYNHRCTVCGRTDVTNPELEFRYCSRCSGYHCYCQDHINNHEHVE